MPRRFQQEPSHIYRHARVTGDADARIELPVTIGPEQNATQNFPDMIRANGTDSVCTNAATLYEDLQNFVVGRFWRERACRAFVQNAGALQKFDQAMCANVRSCKSDIAILEIHDCFSSVARES